LTVRTEKKGPVTTLVVERPESRNAVDRRTAAALADAFRDFEQDETARIAVLFGAGGTFCAGADLKAIAAGAPNRLEADGDGPMGPTRMFLSKPVIAAIAGHAVAGGLELALWCDLRVVEESAVLGVFCRRFGVPLIDGGTVRLPRLIGFGRAMDLTLTGRPVHSKEALAIGLVNRVVPDGTVREAAEKLARELTAFPAECLLADRRSLYEQQGLSVTQALRKEWTNALHVLSLESVVGATRFAEGQGRHGRFDEDP